MLDLVLQPHPTVAEPAVRALTLAVERDAADGLRLDYRLTGRLRDLRIPSFTRLRAADRLWEHTCFELFLRRRAASGYRELNVAPSGAWAAYAFTGYREGMTSVAALAPLIEVRHEAEALHVRIALRLQALDPQFAQAALELAPAAVIENAAGQCSYWAAQHADAKPDFHQAAAFVIPLPPAES